MALAAALTLSLGGLAAPAATAQPWLESPIRSASRSAVTEALRVQIQGGEIDPAVAAFYRERGYRPVWAPGRLRLDVDRLAERLGVDASAARDDPWRMAEVELAISTAYVARERGAAFSGNDEVLAYVDPLIKVSANAAESGRAALEFAAAAPTVADLLEPRGMGGATHNRLYDDMMRGLERYRVQWAGLPDIKIAAGPELGLGDRGRRVEQLRTRLGLPETGGLSIQRWTPPSAPSRRRTG
ncbi:hypothetical protein LRS10_20300 [Phenylobacterium sp. J426]|uniref:hypothetical protein n=1 Tax=Phenylobacterium sp. J426 TaxID=2898439 RepID=UPI00215086C6|nr:hypothetical protein [Phenylobacterium sp. J426]MCR5876283.1 hypothetical protein [Phenylobacterium sp. J426]